MTHIIKRVFKIKRYDIKGTLMELCMLYYNYTISTLETDGFNLSISLLSKLILTKPQPTPLENSYGHEWQWLTVYQEFGDTEWYGQVCKIIRLTAAQQGFGPNSSQTLGCRRSQINTEVERVWPSSHGMTTHDDHYQYRVSGTSHCFKAKLPRPLVSTHMDEIFWI